MPLFLASPVWVLWALWTMAALLISWYVPGTLLISRLKLKSLALHHILAWSVGLVLWAAQGVIFGYLGLRWLSFLYVILAGSWLWLNHRKEWTHWQLVWKEIKKTPRWLIGIFIVGTFIQVLPVIGSGWRFAEGINFYRINAYDGVMHLAYAESIIQQFPPREPGAFWLPIVNYHYWSDVVIAELARVWQIPITFSFYQVLPLFLSLLTGLGVYQLIKIWGGTRTQSAWSLFFLYAAGELTYALMWVLHQEFGFGATAAIDNGAMQFLNSPHCFAKALFIAGLIALHFWWQKGPRTWWTPVVIILQASLVGMKVYFGMFAALGIAVAFAFRGIQYLWKRQLPTYLPEAATGIAIAILMASIFFPVNRHAGGLIYSPLEWPKLFLGQNNLNYSDWWLRRQVYEAAGNTRNLIILDTFAIIVCLLCVHGTRLLGLWPRRWWKIIGWPSFLYLSVPTLVFTWLGLFTLQESGLFNVFNFFAVSTIPLALASGWLMGEAWQSHRKWLQAGVLLVALVTIPRVVNTTWFYLDTYFNNTIERQVSTKELEALIFMRDTLPEESVVQASPLNSWDRNTPYISFFSQQKMYLTGVGMMDTHNQPVQAPYQEMKKAFLEFSGFTLREYLRDLGISHLYLTKHPEEELAFPLTELGTVEFENEAAVVIRIN